MIILTGGAGMIGSMIAWHLNTILNENKFVVFDDLVNQDQEKNLAKRKFIDLIDKNDLPKFLKNNKKITAVIHMGAISATTESNFNKLLISVANSNASCCVNVKSVLSVNVRRFPSALICTGSALSQIPSGY